ncbi:MAG TPA: ketose-bisphosphate aldolase [Phycisphaerae bacterium]|nr:ketose-bisphosphate aldolase [Phycisphaerae bacterium]
MPLVTMRQVLDEAAKGQYGVGSFNISNMEQIQAVLGAARETKSPVIVQVSRKARAHAGDDFLRHLVLAAVESYPEIPFVLHQDHGNSPALCQSAIDAGFTSVMMDGSLLEDGKTPSDFEYNVRVTRQVVESAHSRGVSVEAELGTLGGIEDGHGAGLDPRAHLTDPDQAVEFVKRTNVDALAIAVGTSHGAYKFRQQPGKDLLAIDLVERIHQKLPQTHLVMHGSSSVLREQVDLVNRYGGRIRETWGVPFEIIRQGIRSGVRKINVDTDSRLAFTGAIRKMLAESPEAFDPRQYLQAALTAMQEDVALHMRAFGQAGHAGDYAPRSLAEMAAFYRKQ